MNLYLAEEMFTIVGCYEVALRNAIDSKSLLYGMDHVKTVSVKPMRC